MKCQVSQMHGWARISGSMLSVAVTDIVYPFRFVVSPSSQLDRISL